MDKITNIEVLHKLEYLGHVIPGQYCEFLWLLIKGKHEGKRNVVHRRILWLQSLKTGSTVHLANYLEQ